MVKYLHYYDQLASTNTTAYELAQGGAKEGEVVIADTQFRGRGRLDRVWHSPPGKNIYLSLILRPSIPSVQAPQLTLAAGVAVAETVSRYCPEGVRIKWPNDIQVGGRKISGILTEAKASPSHLEFVIVGIGINVNMEKADFPSELRDKATSLKIETGRDICRFTLLSELFLAWDKWYEAMLTKGFRGIKDTFISYAPLAGKMIQVTFGQEVLQGEVIDIDDEGAVRLKNERGEVLIVTAGEIELKER